MIIRQEVKRFAETMEYKLKVHDDRPGWKHCTQEFLLHRLKEELQELEEILKTRGDGWIYRLSCECADVANFAMMIQDSAVTQWADKIPDSVIPLDFM